jgi:hypothetical protein
VTKYLLPPPTTTTTTTTSTTCKKEETSPHTIININSINMNIFPAKMKREKEKIYDSPPQIRKSKRIKRKLQPK